MAARQVAIATSVKVAHQALRHAPIRSRVVAEYQAHRARRQTRTRQALAIVQVLHHHRAARRRTTAVAQARQVQAIAQAHRHRAAAVAHRHRAAAQAHRAHRALSAVARRVVVAVNILQGVCLHVWHTPCRNTPKTLLIV